MDEVRVAVGVLTPAWIEEFLDSRRAQTAHVGHQWLGRYGKTDSGVVTVTTLWADERLYYPVHAVPYTPARHFAKGKSDPGFRTKLAVGADLAVGAQGRGVRVPCGGRRQRLRGPGRVPRRARGSGAAVCDGPQTPPRDLGLGADAYTPAVAARALAWNGPDDPGDWTAVSGPSATGTPRPGTPPTRRWAGGDPTTSPVWWWPPPTRPPCRTRPPGTWPPTCPGPAARARKTARTRRRTWPRSRELRHPALDRAELQAGQGPAGLGRLPGPLRHRDPPPPGPGQLRVLLLLGRLVRRKPATARDCGTAAGARPRREGGRRARAAPSWPRALRAVRAWLSPGSRCSAGGRHGRRRPRPAAASPDRLVPAGCGLHLYIRN